MADAGRKKRARDYVVEAAASAASAAASALASAPTAAPVNAAACAISTLESLCGILFPATLIARIASLPAVPRGNDD